MVGRVSIQAPTRQPTITVAAANSSSRAKRAADFVCIGADDQIRIQSALDALNSGESLCFSSGQYTVSAPVVVPANTAIYGEGYGTHVRTHEPDAQFGLQNGIINIDTDNVVVSDMRLDGRWAGVTNGGENRSSCLILNENSSRCRLSRLWCHNATQHGLAIDGSFHHISAIDVSSTARHGVSFGSGNVAPRLSHDHTLSQLSVRNIRNTEAAIEINDGAHRISITNVNVDGANHGVIVKDHGRVDESCHDIVVHGLTVKNVATAFEAYCDSMNSHYNLLVSGVTGEVSFVAFRLLGQLGYVSISEASLTCDRWMTLSVDDLLWPKHVRVSNCKFTGNNPTAFQSGTGNNSVADVVEISNVHASNFGHYAFSAAGIGELTFENCRFVDNSQSTQKRGAIRLGGAVGKLRIAGCKLGRESKTDDLHGIRYESGASVAQATIIGNDVNAPVAFDTKQPDANWIIANNQGYKTKAGGVATVASGNTSIVVTHGLDRTPAAKDISVTPTNSLGDAAKFWISSVGATQFTINVDTDPGATTATFAWSAEIKP